MDGIHHESMTCRERIAGMLKDHQQALAYFHNGLQPLDSLVEERKKVIGDQSRIWVTQYLGTFIDKAMASVNAALLHIGTSTEDAHTLITALKNEYRLKLGLEVSPEHSHVAGVSATAGAMSR